MTKYAHHRWFWLLNYSVKRPPLHRIRHFGEAGVGVLPEIEESLLALQGFGFSVFYPAIQLMFVNLQQKLLIL
ncbi:MAG: hypothetical protein WBB73_04490 [Candidatus Aminicenantaceae bacterium]